MAEIAVSYALNQLVPLLRQEAKQLSSVHKEFADIKNELESIQAFIKDADKRAAAEGDNSDGIKTWVKQLREIAFRIEDIIHEYMIYVGQHTHHRGYIASLHNIASSIKTLKPRHEIASKIQDIKSSIQGIKERSERYGFISSFVQGSGSSNVIQSAKWHDPRMTSLFIEEDEVVGFEPPRDELVGWLIKGATERAVISIVGMGGLGKTTLAKNVFENQKVTRHFDCQVWITVSQSYSAEGLLKEMMEQFCKATREPLPLGMYTMDEKSLITEMRHYLKQRRYAIIFDDVWKLEFWDEIALALPDYNNGSRIVITTRMMGVAEFCKKSSLVFVHKLQPLPPNKAWELLCRKAFWFEFDGNCPLELVDISTEIVQKCEGLPLAIVAIGGLLSTKGKTLLEWQKLRQNLSLELESNPHLTSLTRILLLSYDDLPIYLKPCLLYFGIYPEDFSISCVRLIRQWIAEGFVKYEKGKTLEEVAEECLRELIQRSLVQVSLVYVDGKARRCRVHDLFREMIIKKVQDLSFCHFMNLNQDDTSSFDETIRRLAVTTSSEDAQWSFGNSSIRSMFIFTADHLPESFLSRFSGKFRLLKVMDFQDASPSHVPDGLGNLLHLRYLSLRNTNAKALPKSIGNLLNLETLDLKQTLISEIPAEINKLTKLRHVLAYYRNYDTRFLLNLERGVKVKDGIGHVMSLQKLYHVEAGLDLIKEFKRLKQLRKLGLKLVKREYGHALCDSIADMKNLECLDISAITEDEIIDLHPISSPPHQLRRLHLRGRLDKLPTWVPKLEHLVRLSLAYSKLTNEGVKLLKTLPNLLDLSLFIDSFDGGSLHFEEGGFQKLRELRLNGLKELNSILIDKGALPVLKRLEIGEIPQLKEVPLDIHRLENLEVVYFMDLPGEFNQSIDPDEGKGYWAIVHVPVVHVGRKVGPSYGAFYDFRTFRHFRA
ncbi:hypothetical protein L6164_000133 [Bauhinia variegata]|uniref:Uncharacterized protein n=1 Tax=Bauhinia variegata TaxID=167791 RepID=A0ACB9Q680_BAUVA|nr:hypothetical protein L6164_000133 [Bauhinia variegata]